MIKIVMQKGLQVDTGEGIIQEYTEIYACTENDVDTEYGDCIQYVSLCSDEETVSESAWLGEEVEEFDI